MENMDKKALLGKIILVIGLSLGMVLFFFTHMAQANVPQTLNLHGKLTNHSEDAQVGTFSVNFSIYNLSSGGTPLYSQTHSVSTDNDGIYTTILSGLTGVDFEQQTYLGITVESDSEMTPRINLTSVPSALAGSGGGSSFWTQSGTDLYYNDGDVGIGDSTPDGILDVIATGTHTELVIDSPFGTWDSSLEFRDSGNLRWQICVDDSMIGDELDFIRGGSSCSSADMMSLTADGLEMGGGRLYFDRSGIWSTSVVSARYNNQFTVTCTTCTVTSISHNTYGQPLWIICSAAGTVFEDQGFLGNLQLAGDFTCGVGDSLHLIYNDVLRDWVEISRSNN